jgi:hypothetical protein
MVTIENSLLANEIQEEEEEERATLPPNSAVTVSRQLFVATHIDILTRC